MYISALFDFWCNNNQYHYLFFSHIRFSLVTNHWIHIKSISVTKLSCTQDYISLQFWNQTKHRWKNTHNTDKNEKGSPTQTLKLPARDTPCSLMTSHRTLAKKSWLTEWQAITWVKKRMAVDSIRNRSSELITCTRVIVTGYITVFVPFFIQSCARKATMSIEHTRKERNISISAITLKLERRACCNFPWLNGCSKSDIYLSISDCSEQTLALCAINHVTCCILLHFIKTIKSQSETRHQT